MGAGGVELLGQDAMRHGRTHSTQDGVVKYLADGERRTINTKWRNVEVWMAQKASEPPIHPMPRGLSAARDARNHRRARRAVE